MIKGVKGFINFKSLRYIVLVVLIIVTAFKVFFVFSLAETKMKASRKIVSVVYDDSGSMKKESNWSSANYAMQAFAALLNKEDDMYITYMSSYKQGAKKVDLTNPQKAVDKIRSEPGEFGKTPIKAVKVAMDKLESINDSDESTQYWLVVFTDGAMAGNAEGVPDGDINQLLNKKYKGKTMPNGSKVYITYMGIGGEAVDVTSDENQGLISVKAGNNIIPALSDISNKVSGRYKYNNDEIKGVDDRTVVLTSRLPLYSISIFSQNSKSKVNNVAGKGKLSVERNIKLEYPEKKGYDSNKSLIGNAAMITNGDEVIPPGDYTVSFSEKIDLSNVVFMYQPAIEMKILIERNGKTIENTDTLVADDSVDVSVIPVNPDTGKEIPETDLPKGTKFNLKYLLNDDAKEESDTRELKGVILKEGKNEFQCTMKVPDYMPINQGVKFTVSKPIEYGIEVDQPSKVQYSRQKLKEKDDNGNCVRFYITGDGKRLSREDQKNLDLVIKDYIVDNRENSKWYIRLGKKDASLKLVLNDDGSYSLYPSGLLIPAFMITAGDYKVDVAIEQDPSKSSQGEFTIYGKASDFKDLIPVLMILLIIMYLIYIVFIKAKFHNQEIIIDVYKRRGYIEGVRDTHKSDTVEAHKFSLHTFLPSPADSIVCQGIRFIADRNSGIIIKTRNLDAVFDHKYQATSGNPEDDFDGLAQRLENGNNIQADYLVLQHSMPIYGKQGKYIYKIYMQ